MDHLRLHDIWLYIIALLLFGIFLLLIYIVYRCSDNVQKPRKRRESTLQFNIEGSAQNLMANFADWKGEMPTYVSQWSFQNECDADLEWKRQLSLKSHCKECEQMLKEEEQKCVVVSSEFDVEGGNVTAL